MSLKPKPPRPMPEELIPLGSKLLAADSPYRLVGDKLYAQYSEWDFAHLYHPEGKPGLSPVDLAFVTVFQDMENLSDREAANALPVRLDWKYALHLPLDYAGFDFSVLSEFRARLVKHHAEAQVFDTLLKQLQAMGLIKRRGRQRTDSIAILTRVRSLNRLELVAETLRLAVRALIKADPDWARSVVPTNWGEVYGERFVLQRFTEAERNALLSRVGPDGRWLQEQVQAPGTPEALRTLPEVQVLATVWAQQFEVVEEQVVFQPSGHYEGKTRIQTPHDPDARYSRKRKREWVGDKLQLTETDDEDQPHLVTDIAIQSSVDTDYEALPAIQDRLAQRGVLPSQHIADSGYVSDDNLAHSANQDIDLIGPVQADCSPQARMSDGITLEQFRVDFEAGEAICPGGHMVPVRQQKDGWRRARFPKGVCANCPLRPRCCTGQGGRTLGYSPYWELVRTTRQRQQTDEWKAVYRQHRGGVEGSLSALMRGQGMRVARYRSRAKRHLHALFVGAAVNLRRTARWWAGLRPQPRRHGLGLVLAS